MVNRRLARVAWLIVVVTISGACSAAPPSGSAPVGSISSAPAASRAPSLPPALSFEDFVAAACSAFDSMTQAIGNPDAGTGSELSDELDRAVQARDGAAATRLATAITTKLDAGRRQAAVAAGWPSAVPMMTELDRVLAAFIVMVAAKRDAANGVTGAVDPQIAFERAGGVEAWRAMVESGRRIDRPAGVPVQTCPTVPINL